MNLAEAEKYGAEILEAIRPFCIQAEIAGSTRRKKPFDIKDIEIVARPNTAHLVQLRDIVNSRWGAPQAGAFPSKYTKIRSLRNIDFFWCDAQTFGLNMFIRTGSADFAKRGLIHWKKITGGGYSNEARLYLPDGTHVPTPTEESVFEALKCKFVRPERRF